MLRKLLIFVLCLSMIAPIFTYEVKAVEYEEKYLAVRVLNDGSEKICKVITDGTNIFIGIDDLIEVAGFSEKEINVTEGDINQITLIKKIDDCGFNQDVMIFPESKMILSNEYGESKFDGYLKLENEVYLDLVDIFNYLRIKAEVLDDKLVVNIPVYTILDFMIYDYQNILRNSVTQLDLLETEENQFTSGFLDALSLACNNFDFKLLIPGWGSTDLKEEQYLKAIQTLEEEDEIFFDENASEYMKNELEGRGFEGVLATGEDLANVLSISGENVETVETIIESLESVDKLSESGQRKINTFRELVNWNGKNFDGITELRAWKKYGNGLSDIIDLSKIAISAYETYEHAMNWNENVQNDLEVLSNLEVDNYGDHKNYVKRIKKVASAYLMEKEDVKGAVSEQVISDVTELLLEKIISEVSVSGKIADLFVLAINTSVSVARCFGNVAEEMDKAELSYMVMCLINIAEASRIETEIEYSKLDRLNLNSGKIDGFRNALRTTLKSNLRCWNYIYYLKSDGKWENTYSGKEVKDKINKMNTYLTLLNESEQYDYALDEDDLITYSPKRIIEILKDKVNTNYSYDIVMEQYQEALENNLYADILNGYSDDWNLIGEYVSTMLLSDARYYKNYGSQYNDENFYLYYALLDIDNNGVEELFIGAGTSENTVTIYDMFSHNGQSPVPCFEVGSFGERTNLILQEDNSFYVEESGGVYDHSISKYCFTENSIIPILVEEYGQNGEHDYYYENANGVRKSIDEDEYLEVRQTIYNNFKIIEWIKMDNQEKSNDEILKALGERYEKEGIVYQTSISGNILKATVRSGSSTDSTATFYICSLEVNMTTREVKETRITGDVTTFILE